MALDRAADRRLFLPAVSVFPLTDYILPFLPNQMLLVALSMLHPKRWRALALTFILATGLGALLTAFAVQAVGPWLIEAAFGGRPDARTAGDVMRSIEQYGLLALIFLAMLPWPPRTGVLVCAIAGLPPICIGLAVGLGRIIPAVAYSLIGAKAPHYLRRLDFVDRLMLEVETARVAAASPKDCSVHLREIPA